MSIATRDDLFQQARVMPRDLFGLLSIAGYFVAIIGLALLFASAPMAGGEFRPDWRVGLAMLATGAGLAWWAGAVIQRRFVAAGVAAGLSPAQIREIEDEAERLNEKED